LDFGPASGRRDSTNTGVARGFPAACQRGRCNISLWVGSTWLEKELKVKREKSHENKDIIKIFLMKIMNDS